MDAKIELSVVIPTLNEEENLEEILFSLALQEDVDMEIIVADGGSEDSTCRIARESNLRLSLIRGEAGRARQLNAGGRAAAGEYVLFLHADSRFKDRTALRTAVDALGKRSAADSGRLFAGHFVLSFRGHQLNRRFGYSYLESKARLDRKGCSHGDQGILMPGKLFRSCGGFDENCQLLAETRLADRLRSNGQWLLLPAEITTSARRFEKEGLKERQILNAVIMILGAVGREDLLDLPGLYSPRSTDAKLHLQPFFRMIAQRLSALEENERAVFWERVGEYICENAWQIPFGAEVMLACRSAGPGDEKRYRLLAMYDRHLHRLIVARSSARLAAFACRLSLKFAARFQIVSW